MGKWTKSELIDLSQSHPIIAFDGVCNLCEGFVQWLVKRDKEKFFRYVTSMQHPRFQSSSWT